MTMIKVTLKETAQKRYASSRADLRRITGLSESSLTKILRELVEGHVVTSHKFVFQRVEIDESSIREVQV